MGTPLHYQRGLRSLEEQRLPLSMMIVGDFPIYAVTLECLPYFLKSHLHLLTSLIFFVPGEIKKIEGLLGGKTALPCDVTTKDNNDSLLLLVWYKANKPFYR